MAAWHGGLKQEPALGESAWRLAALHCKGCKKPVSQKRAAETVCMGATQVRPTEILRVSQHAISTALIQLDLQYYIVFIVENILLSLILMRANQGLGLCSRS